MVGKVWVVQLKVATEDKQIKRNLDSGLGLAGSKLG